MRRPGKRVVLRDVSTDPDAYHLIERAIRSNVELPRFDYNDVSRFETLGPDEAAKLVKDYLDKVKLERARAGKAEYVFPSGIGAMRQGVAGGYGIRVDDADVLAVLKAIRQR